MEQKLLYADLTYKVRGAFFIIYNILGFGHKEIIVELKSTQYFPPDLGKQILNYLKVTGYKLALAVNFGQSKLDIRRIIMTQ